MNRSKEYPDKKTVNQYKAEHVERVQEALDAAAKDIDSDDPPETERIAHIARTYSESRQFQRLESDQRIREARQAVAQDHGMDAGDVSLISLLKVTCSAYTGYTLTSDWDVSSTETLGFSEEVKTDGGKQ